jgi:cyclic dehypoxanthinyl futalosine synthase
MQSGEALEVYLRAADQDLFETAVEVRNRFAAPDVATYLVDRNINYSNVCITDCKFCEFYRRPGSPEAYVLPREALRGKLEALRAAGGTRVLLQGGHHPELHLAWYEDMLRWIREEFPTIEIDAFSPSEIAHLAELDGLPVPEVLVRLRDAGLDGVPGGGGEILDDEVRRHVAPKKLMTAPWLAVMEAAHALDLYTSASMVIGFGEEPVNRVRSLANLRRQQDWSLEHYGRGFLAFISWPLQFESRYGRVFGDLKGWKLGAEPAEYLRHTAFSRCFLDNIPHFQASWPTMGLATAERALSAGCDDMGGTMMEENVVSQAGSVHVCATEDELRRTIRAAGLRPVKRTSRYGLLEARA